MNSPSVVLDGFGVTLDADIVIVTIRARADELQTGRREAARLDRAVFDWKKAYVMYLWGRDPFY